MKGICLKIEQISKKYYSIIKNFPVIQECSVKRLQHKLHLRLEEEKIGKFIIKNGENCC